MNRTRCQVFRPTRNFIYILGVAKESGSDWQLTPTRQIVRPGKPHAKSKTGLSYAQAICGFWHELCGSRSHNLQASLLRWPGVLAVRSAAKAIGRAHHLLQF